VNILILYGPNLNLTGVVSRNTPHRLTLDKLNRSLRLKARDGEATLRIFHKQSEVDASVVLQRQRNWAHGILLIPGIWAQTGYLLRETLSILNLPLAIFHFEPGNGPWHYSENSIFTTDTVIERKGDSVAELEEVLTRLMALLHESGDESPLPPDSPTNPS